jgi:hypothetical protein
MKKANGDVYDEEWVGNCMHGRPPPPSLLFLYLHCFSQICIEYYVDTNTTSPREKKKSLS